MKKQNKNDNAANRKSYVGHVFNIGEKQEKEAVLNSLNPEWARLHREGYIHINDLDAYGLTYTPNSMCEKVHPNVTWLMSPSL